MSDMDETQNPQAAAAPAPPVPPTQPAPQVTPSPQMSEPEPAPDVSIPDLAPTTMAPTSPSVAPAAAPSSGMKKILLVEDDDSLATVYLTRLQAENFEVERVPNGEEALAATLRFKPDLILLDVMMPKVSGFDVLDILRNTPETGTIKVIMLTALSQEADQQRAKELGVNDYLVKSQVVIADVVDRIKFHLGM